MDSTKNNVSGLIEEHRQQALKHLERVKEQLEHLERAINDPEIATRGIGVLWVHNVSEPLETIRHHATAVDTLACVRVWG